MQELQPRLITPELRTFRAPDLEALYQLDQVCFAPGVAYSRAEVAALIRRADAGTWLAETRGESGNELAGFVIARCDQRKQGHIITLDVAPAWRRRAIGTLLMDEAEGWMLRRGGKAACLETAEDNAPAQMFYARRGYTRVRRIEGYYGDGAAAWLMAKQLQSSK